MTLMTTRTLRGECDNGVLQLLKRSYEMSDLLAEELVSVGKVKRLKKGEFLHYQNENKEYITFILSGILGFHPPASSYTGPFYNLITPGVIINDDNFVLSTDNYLDVKAATECRLIMLPFKEAEQLLNQFDFSLMLNRSLAIKQRFFQTLFDIRMESDQREKLLQALKAIADASATGTIALNIGALAALLKISRNSVGKICTALIDEEILVKTHLGYRFADKSRRILTQQAMVFTDV